MKKMNSWYCLEDNQCDCWSFYLVLRLINERRQKKRERDSRTEKRRRKKESKRMSRFLFFCRSMTGGNRIRWRKKRTFFFSQENLLELVYALWHYRNFILSRQWETRKRTTTTRNFLFSSNLWTTRTDSSVNFIESIELIFSLFIPTIFDHNEQFVFSVHKSNPINVLFTISLF